MTANDIAPESPSVDTLTVYSTDWCPYCIRLKGQLREAGIEFVDIDIEADPAAAEFVASVNDGNHVVPTLLFPGGETATNPPLKGVQRRLGLIQD